MIKKSGTIVDVSRPSKLETIVTFLFHFQIPIKLCFVVNDALVAKAL
jgi:hypothetical protein